jgi:hypothetical protein
VKIQHLATGVCLLTAVFCTREPADAQTATPTPTVTAACTPRPTAPPCAGTKRVRINWAARRPSLLNVSVSATNCGAPASCTTSPRSGVQTVAPLTLTITDATCQTFTTTFAGPGVNGTGCPGGKDSYVDTAGKLKLIYGSATTVLGFMKIPFGTPVPTVSPTPEPTPPAFVGPLQFSITDANGYSVGGTASTCFTYQSGVSWRLKCF